MKKSHFLWLLPLAGGALAAAGWRLYSQRPRGRIPSDEGLYDADVARGFGRISAMPQMQLFRRLVARRAIEMMPQGTAVDLGCGPGLLVVEIARQGLAHQAREQGPGLKVVGIDVAAEMLSQGEANARRVGMEGEVSFRQADVQQLPFLDGTVDLAVSTLSLHHWSHPVAVLDEIARVLRPGGAFLVVDLRRDMPAPAWLLLWFAQHVVVPSALRHIGEPLGSRNAAYTPLEALDLLQRSRLGGGYVTSGPLWLTVEGFKR